ncbi:hypothetical protein HK100_009407 [Physocladia obscura]|uniref:Uncharacterized protein n=1 Tax=Physocladia obscura TaxID=109957 RepID=A0AAD5XF50_9FUNG|nr:hypothetical protein HK100_009407 [Physocladia obscura]
MSAPSEDVMKFLDGLDEFVPAKDSANSGTKSGSETVANGTTATADAKTAGDVLSFLDELDASQAQNSNQTETPTQSQSQVQAQNQVQQNQSHVQSAADSAWGWAGSIWSTAQATASKVSSSAVSTAVSSLKIANNMVEETLANEKVKGIVAEVSTSVSGVVNKETVGKLTHDISKFTINSVHTLGDIIAPPLESDSHRGNSSISHLLFSDSSSYHNSPTSSLPPLASTITIWLCAELQEDDAATSSTQQEQSQSGMVPQSPADMIHDFVQATANSLWLHGGGAIPGGSGRATGKRVVVNSVTDPSPRAARGVQEAVKVVEATVQRLQKLSALNNDSDEDGIESPSDINSPKPPNVTLFLVIQPYTTLIPSPLHAAGAGAGSATALHRHYLTMLVNPATKSLGLDVVSAISQSVRADKGGRTFGGKEMSPALKQLMEKWADEQIMRVVEAAVNDVLEEFSLRSKGVTAL